MAATRHGSQTNRSGSIPSLALDSLIAAGLGIWIGVLDFAAFDASTRPELLHEFVFSKPHFIGLSYLGIHVTSYAVVAVAVFFASTFTFFSLARIVRKFPFFYAPIFFTLIFPMMIVIYRIKKVSVQPIFTFVFLAISFSSILLIFRLFWNLSAASLTGPSQPVRPKALLAGALVLVFLAVALVPDAAGLPPRAGRQFMERQHGRPNVILLVLDTVRAENLSCYGDTDNQTPNIDSISRAGALFLNAYSSAPWTLPSHASIFTGLSTSHHGVDWSHRVLSDDHLTLAEFLHDRGYATAGFSENPNVCGSNGLTQGFDEFHELWRTPPLQRLFRRFADSVGLKRERREYSKRTDGLARRWIAQQSSSNRPFFAFINLMAAHLPRYPRGPMPGGVETARELERIEAVNLVPERHYLQEYALTSQQLELMEAVYDHEIRYLDRIVGDFFSFLGEQGPLENTLFILTSDHGELFGEHGFIEHQFCVYEPVIRVPLIVLYPRIIQGSRVGERVSVSSIFPTIVSLVDPQSFEDIFPLPTPLRRDILGSDRDAAIIVEHEAGIDMLKGVLSRETQSFDYSRFDRNFKSIIVGDDKYIWSSDGSRELFDLSVDPYESTDTFELKSDLAQSLHEILVRVTDLGKPQGPAKGTTPELDSDTIEALRALGYIP